MTVYWREGTIYGNGLVTGSPPQWGDLSDATYVTAYRLEGGTNGFPLFDWTAHPDAALITAARIGVRARVDPAYDNGGWLYFYLTDFTASGGDPRIIEFDDPSLFTTTVSEQVLSITDDAAQLAKVQSALSVDEFLQVNFSIATLVDTETRADIFEVWLELDFDAVPGRTFSPVLRVYPRPDGRGASSAARVWPRPPTGSYGRSGPGSLV